MCRQHDWLTKARLGPTQEQQSLDLLDAMIDTSASINIIDKATFAKLPEIKLENTKTRAFSYNTEQPVKFKGKFNAVLETN